jgi:hypothetical protein
MKSATIERAQVSLRVNGRLHAVTVEPRTTLLGALRDELGLTGTKIFSPISRGPTARRLARDRHNGHGRPAKCAVVWGGAP